MELLDPITSHGICPKCHGARLNQKVLSCRIAGKKYCGCDQITFVGSAGVGGHGK